MTMVKQQGALLAKGRLMGLQFDVLFTDGLYTEISKNAIETAAVLKKGLAEKRLPVLHGLPHQPDLRGLPPTPSWKRWRARQSSASGKNTTTPTR